MSENYRNWGGYLGEKYGCPPEQRLARWSARAIFHPANEEQDGYSVRHRNGKRTVTPKYRTVKAWLDFLPDRQDLEITAPAGREDTVKEHFQAWGRHAMNALTEHAQAWDTSSSEVFTLRDGPFLLVATCNRSYGYCYVYSEMVKS